MNIDRAKEMLTDLGNVYVAALAERGYKVEEDAPIFNGLAAYYMLEMKGEFEELDESVDKIVRIIYEEVVEKLEEIGKQDD